MLTVGTGQARRLHRAAGPATTWFRMFSEMYADSGSVRVPYEKVAEWVAAAGVDLLKRRQNEAEAIFRKIGITFAVYGEGGDRERLNPFDLIPRVFGASEWRRLSRGHQAAHPRPQCLSL